MITEEKLAKLPKWAQAEVRDLVRRLDAAEDENDLLRRRTFGEEGSNTYLQPYDDQPVLLPDQGLIEFRLGYGSDGSVQATAEGTRLEIRGRSPLRISPVAANLISIELQE